MNVPFVELSIQHQHLVDDLLDDMRTLLKNCDFILGNAVRDFETAFARMSGAKYCIGVNSGTDALVLALRALEIGPGDEVILPAYTFIATADAIIRVGAKPVFVDVTPDTLNINVEAIPDALTAETKAILPVHLFGRACNMKLLREIAEQLGLSIIEDVAQACGTIVDGKWCGRHSEMGCFSFYPTKNLGAIGDAGCIVTDDEELARSARELRDHGRSADGSFTAIGYNSRMGGPQAIYLKHRLDEFEDSLFDRIENARLYNRLLADVDVVCPEFLDDRRHTYNYYSLKVRERDRLLQYLRNRGIGCAVYYPRPLPLEPCLQYLGFAAEDFPVALEASQTMLSLPMFPGLTKRQIETVCGAVVDCLGNRVPA